MQISWEYDRVGVPGSMQECTKLYKGGRVDKYVDYYVLC